MWSLIKVQKECKTCAAQNGEIRILTEWNRALQYEVQELKSIIYRKYGLSKTNENPIPTESEPYEPKSMLETPKSGMKKIQNLTEPILKAQQDHWNAKLKEMENGTVPKSPLVNNSVD